MIDLSPRSLRPGGYLMLGHSESLLDRSTPFVPCCWRRRGVSQAPDRGMTRVFVVDDSAFIRKALARVLQDEPGLSWSGEAANGAEAVEKIPAADPGSGDARRRHAGDGRAGGASGAAAMEAHAQSGDAVRPYPEGAEASIEALAAGAVDFIDKTSFNVMDLDTLRREVIEKLRIWGPKARRENSAEREQGERRQRCRRTGGGGALRAMRNRCLHRRSDCAAADSGADPR